MPYHGKRIKKMSISLQFFLEDVFGESRYSGNPLAVFRNASVLTEQEMQRIAREINFSETTFILSDVENAGGYDVRIFTPASEVRFAGHPTLGTAHVIRERIIRRPVGEVVLNLKVGKITVRFSPDGILWMKQNQPEFGECLPPDFAAPVLNLPEDDIEADFPVEVVSTGLPCTIVPLKSREALSRVRVDREKYDALVARTLAKVLLVFGPQGPAEGQRLGVRVFPLAFGIAEDPATGSGNGCLGAYLVKHRYFGSDSLDIQVGQGYEIGRPSVVHIRSREADGRYAIEIGGRVFPVAEGQWG
jgi:trans-2,3-dihydro-3-hydroxyanthranilate isomerase